MGTGNIMSGFTGSPRWDQGIALGIIYFLVLTANQVNCDEISQPVEDKQKDVPVPIIVDDREELASNRVLPVDADHKNKISKPLEASCVQTIKENLVKFLKRHPKRQGRQDDGDDGDGDGEDGIAGIIGNIQEGNGALSTLSQLPSVLPQLVSTFTQLSGAVNMGLNGTDTPNLPSFLVRQGMEAVKFFQAIAGAANGGGAGGSRLPSEVHVERIPGQSGPAPMRAPARLPGAISDPYPGQRPGASQVQGSLGTIDNYDYLDEIVMQPAQPNLSPLIRPGGGNGGGGYNQFLGGASLANQGQGFAPGGDPAAAGLPQGTSLWQIYKSFRTMPEGVNGTLSNFQLAHPEAFSNELLQSISQAISSIRGHMGQHAVATDRPNSEILKQYYPQSNNSVPPQAPIIFSTGNRPTLSVYKPKESVSGVGIDLSNLALNVTQTAINKAKEPPRQEEEVSSAEEATPAPQEELESPPLGEQRPGRPGAIFVSTGTLEKLQAQNARVTTSKPAVQYEKSPASGHLSGGNGGYMPVVSEFHVGEDTGQKVGPQTSEGDHKNGFDNKQPYTPVLNGILLEAPRLTPSPYEHLKRPTGLVINTEAASGPVEDPENTTPFAEFHFQVNKDKPGIPPNYHGPDPTTKRSPTLIAAIPSKFEYDRNQQHIKPDSGVVPQSLFPSATDAVPDSDVERITPAPEKEQSAEVAAPEEDIQSASAVDSAPPQNMASPSQESLPPVKAQPPPSPQAPAAPVASVLPTQQQINAQRLLQQLLYLQRVLTRQQEIRRQQNLQAIQQALQAQTTTPEPTTLPPPPPPPPVLEVEPQTEIQPVEVPPPPTTPIAPVSPTLKPLHSASAPGYLISGLLNSNVVNPTPTKTASSSIANGFASALANNLPPGTSLLSPNKAFLNNPPVFLASTVPPLVKESVANSENIEVLKAPVPVPIRTTTTAPKAVPSTTLGPNQFQFPSFANGPSSYFPQAAGLRPVEPQQAATSPPEPTSTSVSAPSPPDQSNWGAVNFSPAVVQSTNPVLSNVINSNPEPANSLPPTPTPISGAFSPFDPFSNFPSHLQAPSQSAAAPNSNVQETAPVTQATTLATTTTTTTTTTAPTTPKPKATTPADSLPPLSSFNFLLPSGGYFPSAGLPVGPPSGANAPAPPSGSPLQPALPPPAPPRIPPRPPSNDPYSILINPQFQRPAQSGGYPQFVPSNPVLVTSSGLVTPGQPQTQQVPVSSTPSAPIPDPVTVASLQTVDPSTSTTARTISSFFSPSSTAASFTQQLSTSHKISSAISEMSKLPFYPGDSFRPSAVTSPPVTSENPEDTDSLEEQSAPTTNKPFNELFSSSANVSVDSNPSVPSLPPSNPHAGLSAVEENDSTEEQPYPNFPPGKPVYWMNMYYPNGVPVLVKVTSTTAAPTSPKPRRKRTRSTTQATTPVPEAEYYEEEEDDTGVKKARKKKKPTTASPSETDFISDI